MDRLKALTEARRIVAELAAEKNDKGYLAHAMTPDRRVALELQYAEFLIGSQPE